MRRLLRWLPIALAVVLAGLQFVPVERANPPVEQTVDAPPEVVSVLRRSCFDCHSHETRWPWYSRVAPVSFLVAEDVEHGREHVNFSTWNRYDAGDREEIREEAWEEVEKGEMPLRLYLVTHPGARLSEADRAVLKAWAGEATAGGAGAGAGEVSDDGGEGRNRRHGGREREGGGEREDD